jgi:hypothetical protein
MTSLAALAATAIVATPALAAPVGVVAPDTNATATARIVKPLKLVSTQNLDLGTLLLSGAGTWSNQLVGISKGGTFTCPTTYVTCSGNTPVVAKYKVTGTNNQTVTVSAPNVTLTNANDATAKLTLTVDAPATVALSNSGNTGLEFPIGGSILLANDTLDGVYTGTFAVTVDY